MADEYKPDLEGYKQRLVDKIRTFKKIDIIEDLKEAYAKRIVNSEDALKGIDLNNLYIGPLERAGERINKDLKRAKDESPEVQADIIIESMNLAKRMLSFDPESLEGRI